MAGRASALDHEEALLRPNFAVAAAHGAAALAGARLGARTLAGLAGLRDFDLDLGLLAVEGLVQADFHVIAQIRAAPRLLAPPPPPKALPKMDFEDVADIAEISARRRRHRPPTPCWNAAWPITVVGGALLRILQAVIGLADRLEARFGFPSARILVRVIAHGKAAIGRLDRLVVRRPLDFEQFVKVNLGS